MSEDRINVTISISKDVYAELQKAMQTLFVPTIENEIDEILVGWYARRQEQNK